MTGRRDVPFVDEIQFLKPLGRRRAPQLEGGKRVNFCQAKLNDAGAAELKALAKKTGMTESDVVRLALMQLAEAP